jgi:hypothetical protein
MTQRRGNLGGERGRVRIGEDGERWPEEGEHEEGVVGGWMMRRVGRREEKE